MRNVEQTIIGQYKNSPTIVGLVHLMDQYIDPSANIDAFYNLVWNVLADGATLSTYGLDVWGRIVGVTRTIVISASSAEPSFLVGYESMDTQRMPDGDGILDTMLTQVRFSPSTPTNPGGFYFVAGTYTLSNEDFRTLILVKALSNITNNTVKSINQLLSNLFSKRGRCYVRDLGNMAMEYDFEFYLQPFEYAIVASSGAVPHPVGVQSSIYQIDPATTFGFDENVNLQPFDHGVFYPE